MKERPVTGRLKIMRKTQNVFMFSCFFLAAFAFCVKGLCAGPENIFLLDDFEDGDITSCQGLEWYFIGDSVNNGTSKGSFKVEESGGNKSSAKSLSFEYMLGGGFKWPYVQLVCSLTSQSGGFFDLSEYSGVSCYARSRNSTKLRFVIFTMEDGITDLKDGSTYRHNEAEARLSKDFKYFEFPFESFKTPDWWLSQHPGSSKTIDWSKAINIAILDDDSLTSGMGDKIFVDDICFYRGPLRVSEMYPCDGQLGIGRNQDIAVKFNFPVNEDSARDNVSLSKIGRKGGKIDCDMRFSDDFKSLILMPHDGLEDKSKYLLRINRNLTDIYGCKIKEGKAAHFITEIGAASLEGIITDNRDKPLEGVKVSVYPSNVSAITEKNGKYLIEKANVDGSCIYAVKDGYFTGFGKVPFKVRDRYKVNMSLDEVPSFSGLVNPYVFGINYNNWETEGYLAPVEGIVKEAGIKFIRWGGIGKDLIETGGSLTDEFVMFARAIGAEPLIQVRLARGSIKEAAAAVRYCNIEKGYNVKYWSIGNEPDDYTNKGWKAYTAEDYCRDFRAYYNAMKAVDPSIKIAGPDLMGKYFVAAADNWITPFLEDCGDIADIISVHIYPYDGKQPPRQSLSGQARTRAIISSLKKEIKRVAGRDIPLAITEFNLTWDWLAKGDGACNSFYAGLWLADFLGTLQENDIFAATFWDIMEGGSIGFLEGVTYRPFPTYYVFQMFRQFNGSIIGVDSDKGDLSVYCSRSGRNYFLIAVNRNLNKRACVELLSKEESKPNDNYYLKLETETKFKDRYLCFEPCSVTALVIDRKGNCS
ncbi:MAG: Ig-like domain-containing protein, partial [Candidatus Aureabacteria bacterium]|nr:Ig-like domain-containing protein [Candidatus Auribacterota bacterium]